MTNKYTETSIYDAIKLDDESLNAVIQEHLNGPYYTGTEITVIEWRIEKFEMLRRWGFMEKDFEMSDALGKINDPDNDTDIIASGQVQLEAYSLWRKNIKLRFPSE